jgi:hypothetical protein
MKPFGKYITALALLLLPVLGLAAEDWKGAPYKNELDISAEGGLGILDGTAGFEMRGSIAKKILDRGFLSDINDQLYIEAQPGILLVAGSSAFTYSVHLRWDFHKNEEWTLFALGGFGGDITGATLGDRFEFFPRFGIGARWDAFERISFRAELSHEFSGVGIMFLI